MEKKNNSTLYVLRDGDLKSEPLATFKGYTEEFVQQELAPFGLVFQSRREADLASGLVRAFLLALSSLRSYGCRNTPSRTREVIAEICRYFEMQRNQSRGYRGQGQTPSGQSAARIR